LVLRIKPIFGLVFWFSHLKTGVFRFWCIVQFTGFVAQFTGFVQFSLWFSVFANNDGRIKIGPKSYSMKALKSVL